MEDLHMNFFSFIWNKQSMRIRPYSCYHNFREIRFQKWSALGESLWIIDIDCLMWRLLHFLSVRSNPLIDNRGISPVKDPYDVWVFTRNSNFFEILLTTFSYSLRDRCAPVFCVSSSSVYRSPLSFNRSKMKMILSLNQLEKKIDLFLYNTNWLFRIIHLWGEKLWLKAHFQASRACLWKLANFTGSLLHLKLQDSKNSKFGI